MIKSNVLLHELEERIDSLVNEITWDHSQDEWDTNSILERLIINYQTLANCSKLSDEELLEIIKEVKEYQDWAKMQDKVNSLLDTWNNSRGFIIETQEGNKIFPREHIILHQPSFPHHLPTKSNCEIFYNVVQVKILKSEITVITLNDTLKTYKIRSRQMNDEEGFCPHCHSDLTKKECNHVVTLDYDGFKTSEMTLSDNIGVNIDKKRYNIIDNPQKVIIGEEPLLFGSKQRSVYVISDLT